MNFDIDEHLENNPNEYFWISYCSKIDSDIIKVMELSQEENESIYSTHIAEKMNEPEHYIELIKTILSDADLMDYGTSPRGAWLTTKGNEFIKKYKELKKLEE